MPKQHGTEPARTDRRAKEYLESEIENYRRDFIGYARTRASAVVRSFVDPADLAEQAILVVLQKANASAAVRPYALGYRIIRCLCARAYRERKRCQSVAFGASTTREDRMDALQPTADWRVTYSELCASRDALRILLRRILQSEVLNSLPTRQRQVCELLGSGRSAKSIGKSLGIETSQVTRALAGAAKRIQRTTSEMELPWAEAGMGA